jgi:hypothetical protein
MPERAQQVGQEARESQAHEYERDRHLLARLARAACRREQARAQHAQHDREHRQVLGAARVLAQHALA